MSCYILGTISFLRNRILSFLLEQVYYGVFNALHFALLGIVSDDIAEFGNSWAIDLPQERPCPEVDDDFPGPCSSESDMDVCFHAMHNGFELS